MAWTQLEYDTLVSAIASGAQEIEYADKRLKYNSLDDLLALKKIMEQELGITTPVQNTIKRRSPIYDSGL